VIDSVSNFVEHPKLHSESASLLQIVGRERESWPAPIVASAPSAGFGKIHPEIDMPNYGRCGGCVSPPDMLWWNDNWADLQAREADAGRIGPRISKATSSDVARLVGVNQSTASRAPHLDGEVSTETRTRAAAARQLGYTPNAIARSLITQKTNIVGDRDGRMSPSHFQPYILEAQKLQARGRQVLGLHGCPDQQADDLPSHACFNTRSTHWSSPQ